MQEFQAAGRCSTRYRTGSHNVLPAGGEAPILEPWGNAGSPLDGLPSKLCATPDLSGRLRMDALQPSVAPAELYSQPERASAPMMVARPEAATAFGRLIVVVVPLRMRCNARAAHCRETTRLLPAMSANDHQKLEHGTTGYVRSTARAGTCSLKRTAGRSWGFDRPTREMVEPNQN
jgi:hypothetical protein